MRSVSQFDVVVARLKAEYNVDAIYEGVSVNTARWVGSDDTKSLKSLRKCESNLALDGGDNLTYIALPCKPKLVDGTLSRYQV